MLKLSLLYNNIVFVTISMTGGGTERVISTLANHMAKSGYNVAILMIAGSDIAYSLDDRIEIKTIGESTGGRIIPRLRRIIKIRQFIREKGPCNVIAMGSVCGIFTAISTLFLRKNHLIISERNNPNRINRHAYSWYMKCMRNLLYMSADRIVLQTDESRNVFDSYIAKNATVICNPLPDSIRTPFDGIRTKKVVAAGRLTADKDYGLLIKAFDIFSLAHQDYSLDIYGEGELEEELTNLINKCENSDKMKIHPFKNDLHNHIVDSRMFVSTSISEGISNSILEALALGIPVIGTDCPIGGTKMLINHGVNGYLIDVGDVNALIKYMTILADDDEMEEKMSYNATMARDIYSTENICNQWYSIMK